ncbi:MAG TPA: DUF6600 domain-containing protein [Devosia sp.]
MIKYKFFAPLALAGLLLSTSALSPVGPLAVVPAQAQSASVSFNLFFDELEPHGVWVRHPQYRYVFCPTGVDTNWRPYTRGRWLNLADRGWYFDSDEPFAWATYHYGRWLDDDNLGWCWVPGTKWAPAWVSWRRGGDVIGWAPLPPEREGFSISLNVTREDLPETYWVYTPTRSFIEPDLSFSIVFGNNARNYYRETEFLGPVVVQGDVVTNNVIEVTYIEQQINQEITVYNVEEASDPSAAAVEGDTTIQVFSQDIPEPTEEAAPAEAVDEAQATEVITKEGGTIGAAQDAEATDDPNAAGEAVQTDEVEAADPAAADAETAEPEATAADEQPDATETDASEPDATTPDETEVTPEDQQPAATEETETEQPAATDEDAAAPAATEEEAAPAEADTEEASEPAATETEDAAAPADADSEQTEEAAPAEESADTPDCPPELLVDGVCQVPDEEANAPAETTEGSSDTSTDSDSSDAEGTSETETVAQ